MLACKALKLSSSNSAIVVVDPIPTETFVPTCRTWPIWLAPVPTISELKSILRIFISWSLVNFSVGSNNKFFVPDEVISVFKSPNFNVVKSVDFSNNTMSSSSVNTTISLNWISNVSGSIICIK